MKINLFKNSLFATTDTVKITNFADLQNVKVTSADSKIATATLASDTITFTAVAVGNTSANITADSATDKKITINVTAEPKIDIDITKEDFALTNTTPVKRVINNYDALKTPAVSSKDATIATATLDGNNKGIQVTAVKNGSTTCTITADNANPVTLNITVNLPAQITTDKSEVNLTI